MQIESKRKAGVRILITDKTDLKIKNKQIKKKLQMIRKDTT